MWYSRRYANQDDVKFEFHHYPEYQTSETLAISNGETVGQMEFAHTSDGVITTHAILEPEFRGMGHGKAMYQFSWSKLKELGVDNVFSDVKVMPDARRVYESLSKDWNVTNPENSSHYSIDLT